MPYDSDPITVRGKCPDDLTSVIFDILSSVQYKLLGLMLVIFLILSSDVFINRILSQFNGAVNHKCATSWGTYLQGLFLVLGCITVDIAVKQKII